MSDDEDDTALVYTTAYPSYLLKIVDLELFQLQLQIAQYSEGVNKLNKAVQEQDYLYAKWQVHTSKFDAKYRRARDQVAEYMRDHGVARSNLPADMVAKAERGMNCMQQAKHGASMLEDIQQHKAMLRGTIQQREKVLFQLVRCLKNRDTRLLLEGMDYGAQLDETFHTVMREADKLESRIDASRIDDFLADVRSEFPQKDQRTTEMDFYAAVDMEMLGAVPAPESKELAKD